MFLAKSYCDIGNSQSSSSIVAIVATIVAVVYVFYCLPWKKPRSRSSEAGVCDKKLSL